MRNGPIEDRSTNARSSGLLCGQVQKLFPSLQEVRMKNPVIRFLFLTFATWALWVPVSAAAEHGSLRAGAARVDITPPVNPEYPPSGKYEHERLYVRAIVLDNGLTRAALLNADLGNMPEDVWANASKQRKN
jgi:hypothetical protein